MDTKTPKVIGCHSAYLALLLQASTDPQAVDLLSELLEREPINAITLIDLVKDFTESARRSHQQEVANKRHASNKAAKVFVVKLWHVRGNEYSSKIEFARNAAAQVLKKFDVNVKAETIVRDWLKGAGEFMAATVKKNALAYADGKYRNGKLSQKLYVAQVSIPAHSPKKSNST